MRKILWLARREYVASVKTKGFIIGLVLFPVLMSGSAIVIALTEDRVDTDDKRVAVIDRTGLVADSLVAVAEERNSSKIFEEGTGKKVGPAYILEIVEPDSTDALAQKLALSNRVRDGSLHGFVDIGPEALHPGASADSSRIAYYAKNAVMDDVREWLGGAVNHRLRQARLEETGVGVSQMRDLFKWLPIQGLALVSVDEETGEVQDAKASTEGEAILIPLAMGMLMFMMLMMGAIPQLQSVMEEKSQRIAEVMLGCLKPFEFMAGKVLGGIAVTLTAAVVYVIVGTVGMRQMELTQLVPYHVLPWFFAYLIMAIIMLGAMFAALGASCNDPKDAQNMTMPAMLPILIPMFTMFPVLRQPLAGFATSLSLVPPFTPILMVMRLSTPVDIPAWQPWVGLGGICFFTILSVWAAGRIFRVGILMQGKPPRLPDLVRWAIKG
jgi:ABC-type Na+ efflux pump permease subunit